MQIAEGISENKKNPTEYWTIIAVFASAASLTESVVASLARDCASAVTGHGQ
jgi:hypothetical protein